MSARKSITGGGVRRVAHKPHVPYRGDDFVVGKKTGVMVERVDRKSDGFEHFEDVVSLLDKRPPPGAKKNVRRRSSHRPVVANTNEEDVDGEMSMELTDSSPRPAYTRFANGRRPSAPENLSRVESSRRFTRASEVDFDKIPTPRERNSLKRRSLVNGSTTASAPADESFAALQDNGIDEIGGFDNYDPPDSPGPPASSLRKHTVAQANQAESSADGPKSVESSPVLPRMKEKGKQRAQTPEAENEEQSVEDEIAQELSAVEQPDEDDDDGDDDDGRGRSQTQRAKPTAPRGKRKVEVERSPTPEGVRRSRRHKYAPLEWWRREKVVYGRPKSEDKILVPHITEIVRIPKDEVEPLGAKHKRKRYARPRSKSHTVELPVHINPEEGWDEHTPEKGLVLDFVDRNEVERRIAFTSKMIAPKAAANGEWYFEKIFLDADFIAAGQLIIPPKVTKPSKATKDNTYIFYLVDGAINVKIHNTNLILTTGGMFLVPRGNNYFIENIADRNAKLFFTQARKVPLSEEEQDSAAQILAPLRRLSGSQRPTSRPPSGNGRSSSVGAQVNGRGTSHDPSSTS